MWFSRQVFQQVVYNLDKDLDYAAQVNDVGGWVQDTEALLAAGDHQEDGSEQARALGRLRRRAAGVEVKVRVKVHFYRARKYYGAFYELLNFDRGKARKLIADGRRDALEHDCKAEGCLLAG